MDVTDITEPSVLFAEGCVCDIVLLLRDAKGNTLARLKAVKAILASWSPVLRGAIECGLGGDTAAPGTPSIGACTGSFPGGHVLSCSSGGGGASSSGGGSGDYAGRDAQGSAERAASPGAGSVGALCSGYSCGELPVLVDSHKEVEAWRIALCLSHPLDPTCGRSPSTLITTGVVKPLVMLADKYNLQGLLPHCKDMLLDPRSTFGVPGIHDTYKLDALEWIQIAESVPGFEAVVTRCIQQIVASTTSSRGRSQRTGALDQPRYRGHEALVSAMAGLRPETCAKLAASMASCLAVASENMANQDRYSIKPVGDVAWLWEFSYNGLSRP